jgi:hypothetical protein
MSGRTLLALLVNALHPFGIRQRTAPAGNAARPASASAAERASAVAQQRAPVFSQRVIPADVDDDWRRR